MFSVEVKNKVKPGQNVTKNNFKDGMDYLQMQYKKFNYYIQNLNSINTNYLCTKVIITQTNATNLILSVNNI